MDDINSAIVANAGISSIVQNVISVSAQNKSGAIVSCTIIVCSHVVEFPHRSMIVYVLVIISGQLSPSLISNNNPNDKLSMPQLSLTLPPADINSPTVVYASTSSILHCASTDCGQLISGSISSCIVIVWVQLVVLPHWSDIWYTLVIISGHVAPSVSSLNKTKLKGSIPQLSNTAPPAFSNSSNVVYAA